jgi:type IV secretory pathway VirD2 relaxase
MLKNNNKPIRHALELLPAHIRCAKPKPTYRRGNLRARGNGNFTPGGIYSLLARNNQRCIVKTSYTRNTKTRSWAAHGEYLQRDHAQTVVEKGVGFNHESDAINIKTTLRQWQKENDPHVFKLIVSPEQGYRLDLRKHAKDLMQHVQKDLKTKVEWVAIDHHNTDYPHLHILIRGIDDHGKKLVIERNYLAHGFRHLSQELATRVLGRRRSREITLAREQQIERKYVTEIDRKILRKAKNSIVNYYRLVSENLNAREQRLQEIKRLKYLETLGLVEKVHTKSWKLSADLEIKLHKMQLFNDIIQSQARHNVRVLSYEMPVPTQIQEHKPLTGKVIGMGLENELKDDRYLLLEGIDGKVHYIQATDSIVKARDTFKFSNNDVITLEKKKFTNEHRETIEYLTVQNHRNIEELSRTPKSRLDLDVIDFVKKHNLSPQNNFPERSFAYEYTNAMIKRFQGLEKEKIILFEKERYRLAPNWQMKLSRLINQRVMELNSQRSNIHKQSSILKKSHENTL